MKKCIFEDWYYEYSEFPYEIVWALVRIFEDYSCQILACNGKYYQFTNREEKQIWLNDEEYTGMHTHEDLEDDEDKLIYPLLKKYLPQGETDLELVPQMIVKLHEDIKLVHDSILGYSSK